MYLIKTEIFINYLLC